MGSLPGLRFVFVTGKGGVGKSTISALLGQILARGGRKTLVIAQGLDPVAGEVLGVPVTSAIARVEPRLFVTRIDVEQAMREYVEALLGSRLLSDAIFHRKFSRGFLYGIPGLRAWALLGKAWFLSERVLPGPRIEEAPFDTVILDAPATGDSAELLRIPDVIAEMAQAGPFRRDAEACRTMLRDPSATTVLPVCLPEELPVTETEELVRSLGTSDGYPIGPILVNQVARPGLSADEADRVRQVLSDAGADADRARKLGLAFGPALRRRQREDLEARHLQRLAGLGKELVLLPECARRADWAPELNGLESALRNGLLLGSAP